MDKPNKYVEQFYRGLWFVIKVLIVIAIIGILLYARVAIDGLYINWLMK